MKTLLYITISLLILSMCAVAKAQQKTTSCPLHEQHQKHKPEAGLDSAHNHASHFEEVNKRGDEGMGFEHLKTTHHFRLLSGGGSIEVEANVESDTKSRDQIRAHLKHIANLFTNGDFSIPMFIHDRLPPGIDEMKRLSADIDFRFEETARGGRVRISTTNPEARKGIHDFLRFQIQDHQTGDPLEVSKQE
ncbi:MAG TPA: hypothetical protein VF747_14860 [Blastocatellia bacterium]|jgi:hypothetical protein